MRNGDHSLPREALLACQNVQHAIFGYKSFCSHIVHLRISPVANLDDQYARFG